MRIEYRIKQEEAELVRIWGTGEIVRVPRAVAGLPIAEIAPYAFSPHKDREDTDIAVWEEQGETGPFAEEPKLLCGPLLREIHLPDTVRSIGNYAFYGCVRLEVFHGTDQITRMGSGVFTGCRLSRVELDCLEGERTCLKEILTEIRYQVAVTFHFHEAAHTEALGRRAAAGKDAGVGMAFGSESGSGVHDGRATAGKDVGSGMAIGGGFGSGALDGERTGSGAPNGRDAGGSLPGEAAVRTVQLLFPEYLADFVENTPARIVVTEYHGSGGDYRECFYRRELDFPKYDEMFALSEARDSGEAAACVALTRLRYPYRLGERAKVRYEDYVRRHMGEIAGYCLERLEEQSTFPTAEPLEVLEFCCERQYFTKETLENAIASAAAARQTEVLSLLMDERQRRFPRRKKSFSL